MKAPAILIRDQKLLWVGLGEEYKFSSRVLREVVRIENWKSVTFLDTRPFPRPEELPQGSTHKVGDFFDWHEPVGLLYLDRIYFCVQEDLQDFIKNKIEKSVKAGTDEYISPRLRHLKTRTDAVMRWSAQCALLGARWVISRGSRKEIIPNLEPFGYRKTLDAHIQGERVVIHEY